MSIIDGEAVFFRGKLNFPTQSLPRMNILSMVPDENLKQICDLSISI